MKKLLCFIWVLFGGLAMGAQSVLHAQTADEGLAAITAELPGDSLRLSADAYSFIDFGGFLLDPSLLRTPQLPEITSEYLLGPAVARDYTAIFQIDPRWTYGREQISSGFSMLSVWNLGSHSLAPLHTATFRIGDNARLSLYGQYNADGRRVPNPSALPWERNDFVGGLELKANKNFKIRIDVRRYSHNPYSPF